MKMTTFAKALVISAALTVSLFCGDAYADGKCGDCDSGYYNKASACGDDAMNSEARDLCIAIAQSNRSACQNTCSYSDDDNDDNDSQ
jgi:hypothetical protein